MDNKTLIPVPLWVLRNKIERDFEEYMFLCGREEDLEELFPEEEDEGEKEEFPLYDSTIETLKILQEHGVEFDTSTGLWKD